jgi:hypothetical protein
MSDSQASVSDGQTGLNPLNVGEIGISNGADTFSKQTVKPLECRMSTAWGRSYISIVIIIIIIIIIIIGPPLFLILLLLL